MLISQLAKASNINKDTIRYYKEFGLLPIKYINRKNNGYNDYHSHLIKILKNIQKLHSVGFTLKEIKEFLKGIEDESLGCGDLTKIFEKKIEQIREKIQTLQDINLSLKREIQACDDCCDKKNSNCDIYNTN